MSGKENFKKVKDWGKVFILPLKEKKERQKAEHQKEEKKNGGGE